MKELHTIEEWSEAIIKAIDSTVNDDVRIFSTKDNSIAFTVSDVATSHLSYKNNVVINDIPLSSCTDIDTKIQLLKSLSTLNTMVGYHNGVIYSCILFLSQELSGNPFLAVSKFVNALQLEKEHSK